MLLLLLLSLLCLCLHATCTQALGQTYIERQYSTPQAPDKKVTVWRQIEMEPAGSAPRNDKFPQYVARLRASPARYSVSLDDKGDVRVVAPHMVVANQPAGERDFHAQIAHLHALYAGEVSSNVAAGLGRAPPV